MLNGHYACLNKNTQRIFFSEIWMVIRFCYQKNLKLWKVKVQLKNSPFWVLVFVTLTILKNVSQQLQSFNTHL